jgi:hypothetical protein
MISNKQIVCIEYMGTMVTEDYQREIFQVRCVLLTFFHSLIPPNIASTPWHGSQSCREDEPQPDNKPPSTCLSESFPWPFAPLGMADGSSLSAGSPSYLRRSSARAQSSNARLRRRSSRLYGSSMVQGHQSADPMWKTRIQVAPRYAFCYPECVKVSLFFFFFGSIYIPAYSSMNKPGRS